MQSPGGMADKMSIDKEPIASATSTSAAALARDHADLHHNFDDDQSGDESLDSTSEKEQNLVALPGLANGTLQEGSQQIKRKGGRKPVSGLNCSATPCTCLLWIVMC